jgi:hypothetical protein
MKKYIITIGCALCAQVTHADVYDWCEREQRLDEQKRQMDAIERIERQNERIEKQLKDEQFQRDLDNIRNGGVIH